MEPEKISIVVPALNEAESIGAVLADLMREVPDTELIVVDDGSEDGTAEIAAEAGAHVVSHDRCRGYGASLRTGTEIANREYVLFCDADGQHSSKDVKKLMDECDGHDMVVGARDGASQVPVTRIPGKKVLKQFADYLAGENIPDINSGLRIVKKELLLQYIHLMPGGFSFSTTTTFALLKMNRRIKWVPISVSKRKGTSTVSQWKDGPQTLLLILRLAVLFEPLKVFLTVAGGLFVLSVISLVIDIWLTRGGGIGDTTVLLCVATLIIFMFGLLCDQISAVRRELHEKPGKTG